MMIAILLLVLVVAAVSVTAAHRAAERARRSGRMAAADGDYSRIERDCISALVKY